MEFKSGELLRIMDIYLPSAEMETTDKLIWKPHPNGTFSITSFIKTLKARQPTHSSSYDGNFPWKTYWKVKNLAPKIHIFIWKVLHDQSCKMCNGAIEDLEHLFLFCPIAVTAFFGFQMGFRTSNLQGMSINQVVALWLSYKGNFEVFRMGSCMMWALRKARNAQVFEKGSPCIHNILKEATYWFNYMIPVLTDDYLTVNPSGDRLSVQLGLNVDAAFKDKEAAWAVVARDHRAIYYGSGTNNGAITLFSPRI